MTIKQELNQLRQENEELQRHIDYIQGRLESVSMQRDSYANTLQEVCIELARCNNEET